MDLNTHFARQMLGDDAIVLNGAIIISPNRMEEELNGEKLHKHMVIGTALTPEPLSFGEGNWDSGGDSYRMYMGRVFFEANAIHEGFRHASWRADQILCSQYANPENWERQVK